MAVCLYCPRFAYASMNDLKTESVAVGPLKLRCVVAQVPVHHR